MDARPEHLLKAARERFDAGDPYGAIHLLAELIAGGQAFADAHNLHGLCLAMVGKPDEALAAYDRALEKNPRYVDALLNRALALNELGRYDEAADAFRAAQDLGKVDHTGFSAPVASRLANLHADLAEAYVEAGGVPQALVQLELAVQLRPEYADLRYRLARLCMEVGGLDRARQELETIIAERPQFVDAHATLGMVCYLMKDHAAARAAWERCRALAPDDRRVVAYLGLLNRIGG
jgi:tetratricopeptide (TPR) repeat protein